MTTIAMVIGFLPIALAKGARGRMEKRPGLGPHRRSDQFYAAPAGGMPVVYLLVDRAKEKVSRLFGPKKPSGQLAAAE